MQTSTQKLQDQIKHAIQRMQGDGITGATMTCLFQNTSFVGVHMTISQLKDSYGKIAVQEARKARFKLSGELT